MEVKILGTGCAACQSMYNDVNRIIERIMSYGVMSTPVLVINEKIVMVGHRGTTKIEHALRKGVEA